MKPAGGAGRPLVGGDLSREVNGLHENDFIMATKLDRIATG